MTDLALAHRYMSERKKLATLRRWCFHPIHEASDPLVPAVFAQRAARCIFRAVLLRCAYGSGVVNRLRVGRDTRIGAGKQSQSA